MALSDTEVMPDEGNQVQDIDFVTLGMFIIGECVCPLSSCDTCPCLSVALQLSSFFLSLLACLLIYFFHSTSCSSCKRLSATAESA